MKTVHVELGARRYPIVIGPGARSYLSDPQALNADAGQVVLLTDATVGGLHLASLVAALQVKPHIVSVPGGEGSKSLKQVEQVCEQLATWRIERSGLIIALGGGVVGDLAGFVAAIWGRGIRFIQVPTTLLAAIDASVGGKTGVNLAAGKNLVGAFHQPQSVVVDTEFLGTLPERQFVAGLAESVKHAAIRDAGFLDWHEANAAAIRGRDPGVVETLVARNCAIKADVVARDEREADLRAILNYGHTVGHAIEAVLEYELLHGECVALGMMVENEIAVARGLLARGVADRIRALLEQLGLPTRLPRDVDVDALWGYCQVDKKNRGGGVSAVLLRGVCEPVRVGDLKQDEVRRGLVAFTTKTPRHKEEG